MSTAAVSLGVWLCVVWDSGDGVRANLGRPPQRSWLRILSTWGCARASMSREGDSPLCCSRPSRLCSHVESCHTSAKHRIIVTRGLCTLWASSTNGWEIAIPFPPFPLPTALSLSPSRTGRAVNRTRSHAQDALLPPPRFPPEPRASRVPSCRGGRMRRCDGGVHHSHQHRGWDRLHEAVHEACPLERFPSL